MRFTVVISLALAACTTLGPMPATTGISAVPAGRPGLEVQAGLVPGFYLSGATVAQPRGDSIGQRALQIEPDRWLHVPGLIAGARLVGSSGDSYVEPYLGYRRMVTPAIAVAGIGYGSTGHAEDDSATYKASRGGLELAIDDRLDVASWLALHLQAAAAATAISASGRYCADASGQGVDCSNDSSPMFVDGTVRGVYPAATATVALDILRQPAGFLGARLALLAATGTMPAVRGGVEQDRQTWSAFGVTLSIALGAP